MTSYEDGEFYHRVRPTSLHFLYIQGPTSYAFDMFSMPLRSAFLFLITCFFDYPVSNKRMDTLNTFPPNRYLRTEYMPGHAVARRLAISSHLVGRITSMLFITKGSLECQTNSRVNIGLDLKNMKKRLEVPGYTKNRGKDVNSFVYNKYILFT